MWKQFAVGQLAVQALHKTYAIFKGLVVDSIKGAIDSEKAEKSLQAALEITGRTVEGNLKHYLDWAKAKMKVTLYTDEEIQDCQTLLLQLTNLNQNGIDRATKGAMGLATVMGIDLHSAAMMVTKAMEGNYQALGRVGIKVAENLTTEEKQASLLEQLEKLYQRSTKETEALGGSLKQLKISWGELLEKAGDTVIKNEAVREAIKGVKEWVDKLGDDPNFKLWLNETARLLTLVIKVAEKFPKAAKDVAEWLSPLSAQEAGLARETIKLNTAYERFIAAGHGWHGTTVAITAAIKAAAPVIIETGNQLHVMTAEEIKAAEEQKKLREEFTKTAQAIIDKYAPATGAAKKLLDEEIALTKAFDLQAISGENYRVTMERIEKELRSLGTQTLVRTVVSGIGKIGEAAKKAIYFMQEGPTWITKSWIHNAGDWLNKNKDTWDRIQQCANAAISGMDAIMQQSANNRMMALDKEYQKRLELIKNSTKTEEEKNAFIEALDAEYSIKRQGLRRKTAEQGKAISMAEAVMNTASGVTGALTMKPWTPANWILAAITGALGLIQVGIIAAQPIPLAAGAIFKKPVFSPRGDYVAGEGGPEAVIPISEMPRLIRELGGGSDRGYQTERPIINRIQIIMDGREMKNFTIKTVREGGQHGFLGRLGKEMA